MSLTKIKKTIRIYNTLSVVHSLFFNICIILEFDKVNIIDEIKLMKLRVLTTLVHKET